MILHLGDDVAVHTKDIIAIVDLTDSHSAVTGAMLQDVRRQNRILARQGVSAKSAVICAGARKAGGITENPRVYISPISSVTLMQRAHEQSYEGANVLPHAGGMDQSPDDDKEMERRHG
ncbi:MAG: DUF370 domain-containing protein [Clostridia bacterium]|nr:DUF370 domain-containing protein [Clostridia bacterium]